MSQEVVDSILEQARTLAPPELVMLADEIDRLAWRDRMRGLLDRIQERVAGSDDVPSDEEIDRIVDEVRSEKPLYERYWTRRRQSAP